MKVLLISANTVRVPYFVYPLGLDYVAAAINDRHEVRIADIITEKNRDELFTIIKEFNPGVVGISLRNIDNVEIGNARGFIDSYRELVKSIRLATPVPIVLGGSGYTIFPEEILKRLGADYGIIGEGERLSLLLDALEAGRDPAGIPGVLLPGAAAAFPPPLEGAFTRLIAPGNNAGFYISRGGMMNLQTKRGCTFNCVYCTYPHIEGAELRPIPADEVAETALELERAGAKYIFITDSVLNTSFEHSLEVARAFARKGLGIPWGAFFAPTRPPADYYREMKSAGLTHVEFGTESLSDAVLRAYRKPFTRDDVFAAHRAAIGAGLHAAHYLLLGGPGEDRLTLAETLDAAGRLEKTAVFFFCGMRIYPHTKLYDIALAEGQISEADDLVEPVFYHSPGISTDEIISTVEERARGRDNWVIGSGGAAIERVVARLHRHGHTGPLWEYLVR